MAVKVSLSSSLRSYMPSYDPFSGVEIKIVRPMRIKELCDELGIPLDEIKFAIVNGRHAGLDHLLHGDERVALFPAVGGG